MTPQSPSPPRLGIPNTTWKHGAFYWIDKASGWHRLGKTEDEARETYQQLSQLSYPAGTVGWLINKFLATELDKPTKKCPKGRTERTMQDYRTDLAQVKLELGALALKSLTADHIRQYLVNRRSRRSGERATVRANREIAAFSVVMTYAVREHYAPLNPCSPALAERNPEAPRTRHVLDRELSAVLAIAGPTVQDVTRLGYFTAQRISDVLKIKVTDITRDGSDLYLFVEQDKGRNSDAPPRLNIQLTGQAGEIVERRLGMNPKEFLFEATRGKNKGKPYTYDGYASMFKRAVNDAFDKDKIREKFTIHDLRGKGLTDAEAAGLDPQKLAGHKTKAMTRRYLKARQIVTVKSLDKAL